MDPTNNTQSAPAAGQNAAAQQQQNSQEEQAFGQLFFQLLQQTMNMAKKEADDA